MPWARGVDLGSEAGPSRDGPKRHVRHRAVRCVNRGTSPIRNYSVKRTGRFLGGYLLFVLLREDLHTAHAIAKLQRIHSFRLPTRAGKRS